MVIQSITAVSAGTAEAVATGTRTPTVSPPAAEPPPAAPDYARIARAVENINRRLEQSSHNLRFSTDQETGRVVIRVVDTQTSQVIRQIPSEEVLAISQSIHRMQGLLVKQKA